MSEIKGKTGSEFAEKVLSMLDELQIPSDGVRFQCYDTTSSMSGRYNGAQAKLSEFLGRLIPYITCMGHKSNLCVEHSSKESRMIEDFFTTLQNLYNFLTKSTSRFESYLEKVNELQEGLIMKNLSVTRWIGRAESIKAVWNSYEVLVTVLEELSINGNDRDCRSTASNLLGELKDVNFYISLVFMKNILYKMKVVTLNVQEIEIDAQQAVDAMKLTNNEFKRIQSNDEIDRLITESASKSVVN